MNKLECRKIVSGDRIALPSEVKEELGVNIGDYVKFVKIDGHVVIKKVTA